MRPAKRGGDDRDGSQPTHKLEQLHDARRGAGAASRPVPEASSKGGFRISGDLLTFCMKKVRGKKNRGC